MKAERGSHYYYKAFSNRVYDLLEEIREDSALSSVLVPKGTYAALLEGRNALQGLLTAMEEDSLISVEVREAFEADPWSEANSGLF